MLTKRKPSPLARTGFSGTGATDLLSPCYVTCLRTFLALDNLELYGIAFLQTLVSLSVNRTIVYENVRTVVSADEAEAFRVVEPLYGSF
jgi:hypothetical protein